MTPISISRRAFLAGTGSALAALTAGAGTDPTFWSLGANPVLAENQKPGTLQWKLTNGAREREIEGYASATSVAGGGLISLLVSTRDPWFRVELYRLGWYGGAGGRLVSEPFERAGTLQADPVTAASTGLVECRWVDPVVLSVPTASEAPSGIYVAKLTALPSGKEAHVPFVVRDDLRLVPFLFQSAVTTWQAYNKWGGKSLYYGDPQARVVSFDRPYEQGAGSGELFRWEYSMVRFLEREGYDVSYCTNVDVSANPNLLQRTRSFLSVGHDEYWSWDMRSQVEAALARGTGLGFFSANTCYWQIRFESGHDGAENRRMVAYKEAALKLDPFATDSVTSNDRRITTKWRDAPVSRPEDALLGVMYQSGNWGVDADIVISDASHWACSGTGLRNGDHLPGLLGYEVDAMSGNAPAGLQQIAHSPFQKVDGTRYSDMTSYLASSGATVFATGSIQWSWGLDDYGHPTGSRVSAAAQQITRNVLSRLAFPHLARRRPIRPR